MLRSSASEALQCERKARHERWEKRNEILGVSRFGQVRPDRSSDDHEVEQQALLASIAVERRCRKTDEDHPFCAEANQTNHSVWELEHVGAADRRPPLGRCLQAVGKDVEAKPVPA